MVLELGAQLGAQTLSRLSRRRVGSPAKQSGLVFSSAFKVLNQISVHTSVLCCWAEKMFLERG